MSGKQASERKQDANGCLGTRIGVEGSADILERTARGSKKPMRSAEGLKGSLVSKNTIKQEAKQEHNQLAKFQTESLRGAKLARLLESSY